MAKKRKKLFTWGIILLIIVALIGFFASRKQKPVEYLTADAEVKQLVQTVSETGTVKAVNDSDLNFVNVGRIASINVKVGDRVKSGQLLAELDYDNIKNKEKEASAALDVAKANLGKLLAGATEEDKFVSQKNVDQAKSAYDSAIRDLDKTKNSDEESIRQAQQKLDDLQDKSDGYTTSYEQAIAVAQKNLDNTKSSSQATVDNSEDSAVIAIEDKLSVCNTALDNENKIFDDEDAKPVLSVSNLSYLTSSKSYYNSAVSQSAKAADSLNKAKLDHSAIPQAINDINSLLSMTLSSLTNMYKALENSLVSTSFSQTDLDAYKSAINTQISAANAGISAIKTADHNLANAQLSYTNNVASAEENLSQAKANYNDAVTAAKNALATAKVNSDRDISSGQAKIDATKTAYEYAKAQYEKLTAGANIHDVALYQAQVRQAEASLDAIRKQMRDSQIIAPLDGVVSKVNYKIGEQASAVNPVISLLGDNTFNIEVDVSESDIEKVSVGDQAEVTLDAFGDDVKFDAQVNFIEPGETVVQEVIYYKVKVNFSQESLSKIKQEGKMVKSGMTANVTITTAKKDNVVVVPSRAVLDKDNKKIVRILKDGQPQELEVTTGMVGDGGLTEITQGVKEGDIVITSTK